LVTSGAVFRFIYFFSFIVSQPLNFEITSRETSVLILNSLGAYCMNFGLVKSLNVGLTLLRLKNTLGFYTNLLEFTEMRWLSSTSSLPQFSSFKGFVTFCSVICNDCDLILLNWVTSEICLAFVWNYKSIVLLFRFLFSKFCILSSRSSTTSEEFLGTDEYRLDSGSSSKNA